jgi:hypothetical protein
MRDIEFEEKRRAIDPVWRTVKREILDTSPQNTERSQLIDLALRRVELKRAMTEVGTPFFEEFYLRNMLPDKAGPPGSNRPDGRQIYFDLGETFVIHAPKSEEAIPKQRGDLSKADMIQISKQKKLNITKAQHADRLWDWECQLVFPFFDAHPDWLYRQCYDAVCTQLGHEPEPPKFDD